LQGMESCKRRLGAEHPSTLKIMGNLALTYGRQGRWKEAEELEVQVMETTKRELGAEHPQTLFSMNNLAVTWKSQGRDEEAIVLMKNCVQLRERVLGPNHPFTAASRSSLIRWEGEARDRLVKDAETSCKRKSW